MAGSRPDAVCGMTCPRIFEALSRFTQLNMADDERRTFLICCRCGLATIHLLLCSEESDYRYFDADGFYAHEPATYNVFRCDGCTQITMYIWSALHSPGSEFGERTYPEVVAQDPGIPCDIASAYRAAERVKRHSNDAYAIMARKVLELIARDQGVRVRSLSKAMSILAGTGVIPPLLAEAATLIRTFGNTAAHSSEPTLNALHVSLIEKFLHVLIEYVYVAPAALHEFKVLLDIDSNEAVASPIHPKDPCP